MQFARVKGTAICTQKYPGINGLKLLIVQPLNKYMQPVGALQVAVDVVHAGPEDVCVTVKSREAALAMPEIKFVPVDLALIGIVDELTISQNENVGTTLKKGLNQFT
ncbi:MAG: EutN/CcmL family microcompartment protein [Anaerolineaceae bacterium]|nr:EutN/CcmL family microcompartment protein [Anaerolineaceae bacterium]